MGGFGRRAACIRCGGVGFGQHEAAAFCSAYPKPHARNHSFPSTCADCIADPRAFAHAHPFTYADGHAVAYAFPHAKAHAAADRVAYARTHTFPYAQAYAKAV